MTNRIKEMRKARDWSLQDVADEIERRTGYHTSKQAVSKVEKGVTKLTQDWMDRLSAAFECDARDLLPLKRGLTNAAQRSVNKEIVNPSGQSITGASFPLPATKDLKILGVFQGPGRGVLMISPELEHSGVTARPPQLENVAQAFAIYVPDETMEPKFEAGGLAYVNPSLPRVPGKPVLVIRRNDESFLAILVRQTVETVTLRQLNPERTFDIPTSAIRETHRVIGTIDPA